MNDPETTAPVRARSAGTSSPPGTAKGRGPLFSVILLFLLVLLLSGLCGERAAAASGPWSGGLRLTAATGEDNNVQESRDAILTDHLVRLLGEGYASRIGLPWNGSAEASLLLSAEQFNHQSEDGRTQGELRLGLSGGGTGRALQGRLEGGVKVADYPADAQRDYHRAWGQLQAAVPVGPTGRLAPRGGVWSLDVRRTGRTDQRGGYLDVAFEQPLRGRLPVLLPPTADAALVAGLEFGQTHHGYGALRLEDTLGVPVGEDRPDRKDDYRYAHIGLRLLKRGFYRLEYGYRAQQSNSVDARLSRHELHWLISQPIPWAVTFQLYGVLEKTHYRDRSLDAYSIQRPGQLEAYPDDNLVALRLARPVGRGWSAEARMSWYRNESLVVREYYRKQVWTLGLTWETGLLSPF